MLAAAHSAGIQHPTIKHEAAASESLEVTVRIDPKKAHDVLKWTPKHRGFVEESGLYYTAWRLHQHH